MNKISHILSLVGIAILLVSCKEEIDVNVAYKETPIIIGLLDQSEDLHYFKINRGFVGPGNANDFAKIPDSNYFEDVEAVVEEIVPNQAKRTWTLRDTMLFDKSTNGAFFGPAYKAYYFSTKNQNPLNTEATYRLTVKINGGKILVTGETKLVNDFAKSVPLFSITNDLTFIDNTGKFTSQDVRFSKGNSAFASAYFDIKIVEYRGTIRDTISIPWKIFEVGAGPSDYSASAQGQSFYEIIRSGLTNDNTITKRNFAGVQITLTGGAADFYNYINVSKPSSSLAQSKPTFTNLKVNEGYRVIGLFSARHTVTGFKSFINLDANNNQTNFRCLDKNSTRELCQGEALINFLFCSHHTSDNNEDFKCN